MTFHAYGHQLARLYLFDTADYAENVSMSRSRSQVVKMLGVGGSGETWLCIDVTTRKQLAVKFIKRPIPAIVLPMLKYEIKVQQQSQMPSICSY